MVNARNSVRPSMLVSPSELRTEPGVFAYDAWKNVSLGVWVGQATELAVKQLQLMSRALTQRHPEGRSSVIFVLDQVLAPTPEAQQLLHRIYTKEAFACFGIILEGTGFWASGIRSMANNAHREVTSGVSQRVSTSIDDMVTWLPAVHLASTGVTLAPEELRRALVWSREHCAKRALNGAREP